MSGLESNFLIDPQEGVGARSEPQFIIRVGESYFLTLAVWEYNEGRAKTEDQREACRLIAAAFNKHAEGPVAIVVPNADYVAAGHISPTPPKINDRAVFPAVDPESGERGR